MRDRIENQFPDSGLGRVADELIAVAGEVAECAEYLSKTNWPIRIFAGLLIAGMILVLYLASPRVDLPEGAHKFSDVQSIAAGLNIVAIVSVAVLFLLRLETNLKRRRAHGVLHECEVSPTSSTCISWQRIRRGGGCRSRRLPRVRRER